jgi:hypothetical protein
MEDKLRERPYRGLVRFGSGKHLQRQCFFRFDRAVNVARDGRLGPNPMPVVRTSAAAWRPRLNIGETHLVIVGAEPLESVSSGCQP